jgi:hypothetical protein
MAHGTEEGMIGKSREEKGKSGEKRTKPRID